MSSYAQWRSRFVLTQAESLNKFLDQVMDDGHIMSEAELSGVAITHVAHGLGLDADLTLAHEIVSAAVLLSQASACAHGHVQCRTCNQGERA